MLPTDYQNFIHTSRYARWIDKEKRRETWEETVDRFVSYLEKKATLPSEVYDKIRENILHLSVMPSMRAMATAGLALERDNTCAYNCAYLTVDSPRSFDECLYILMCGTGVGYSVEREYVRQLPVVNEHFEQTDTTLVIQDSKAGWARGLRELISLLYVGQIPKWDLSLLRPAGAKLKTFGGRSSGPEPLNELFDYTCRLFIGAAGRRLTTLECHDLMCKIASVVVVGGVRRSAMLSLSNFSDDRMRQAKTGSWWEEQSQRALANNSVAYTEKPDASAFLKEWTSLIDSRSGERGIFYRNAAKRQAEKINRDADHEFGTNPCSEIILRPYQFCNLSEVVIRETDTLKELKEKVHIATILGTIQSTFTNFKYLRKIWKSNTEEERLLGVSLTGIMDHPILSKPTEETKAWLKELRQHAKETNEVYASALGINASAAITCVKPSGTVSQLVNSASGIHPRFSKYYIRTVRGDNKDPLTQFLSNQGIPVEADANNPASTSVFSFPVESPVSSITAESVTALDQLELWKVYQEEWCDHKPSITVYVRPSEWVKVGSWVYENFDSISGIAFLPYTDHIYKQAPYQKITQEQYEELLGKMPKQIDWQSLRNLEVEDNTTVMQELACSAGSCEIVDVKSWS